MAGGGRLAGRTDELTGPKVRRLEQDGNCYTALSSGMCWPARPSLDIPPPCYRLVTQCQNSIQFVYSVLFSLALTMNVRS